MKTKETFNRLADLEYDKYLMCLDNARKGFDENNLCKIKHWLYVSSLALRQSANYRLRKGGEN